MADDGPKKKKPPRKPVLAPRDATAALPVSASSPRAPSPVPTAAKIAFYNLPSFLSDYRSRRADAETQRLLEEFARAGGDVSAHANLFGLSAAGGAAGAAGASMAIPVGGVAQAVKAGASPMVASGLAGAMGGLVQGALGQDDPDEMSKHGLRDAVVGGVGGAALGRIAQFPVMQRSVRDGGALLREMFDEPPRYPPLTPTELASIRRVQEEALANIRARAEDEANDFFSSALEDAKIPPGRSMMDAVNQDIKSAVNAMPRESDAVPPIHVVNNSGQLPRQEMMDMLWEMEHPGNKDAFFYPDEVDHGPLLDKIYGKLPSGGPKGDFPSPMGATPPEVPPPAGDWQPPLASRRFAQSDFFDVGHFTEPVQKIEPPTPPDFTADPDAYFRAADLNTRGDGKETLFGHGNVFKLPKPPIPPSPSGPNLNALLAALGLGGAAASTRRP